MRIISGSARGRRIVAPDTPGTRPATDRVREAVFSSIGPWVEDSRVLDLYAGSGSFGLEALSRGARSAVFVESGRKALAALKSNIETLALGGAVVAAEVRSFLADAKGPYDLIFIDPPWDMPTGDLEAELALVEPLLAPVGELVLSRRHTDRIPETPKNCRVAADKRYGDTRILRYEKEAEKR